MVAMKVSAKNTLVRCAACCLAKIPEAFPGGRARLLALRTSDGRMINMQGSVMENTEPTAKAGKWEKLQESFALQLEKGANPQQAFLHIGKTGGTSVHGFLQKLKRSSKPFPLYLSHGWSSDFLDQIPEVKLNFIYRDPLERTVSAFNSRLRRGRPTYSSQWTIPEAVIFSNFRSVSEFFDAILKDDDYSTGMVDFAVRSIRHLKLGYAHHFQSAEKLESMRSRINIIEPIEHTDSFLERMCDEIGIDRNAIDEVYVKKHVSARPSSDFLDGYSDTELQRLRTFFSTEYEIYRCMVDMNGNLPE